jgi:hypothetical protein
MNGICCNCFQGTNVVVVMVLWVVSASKLFIIHPLVGSRRMLKVDVGWVGMLSNKTTMGGQFH